MSTILLEFVVIPFRANVIAHKHIGESRSLGRAV